MMIIVRKSLSARLLVLLPLLCVFVALLLSPPMTADALPTVSRCSGCKQVGLALKCTEGHANCRACIMDKVNAQLQEEEPHLGRKLACQHPQYAHWIHETQVGWVLPPKTKRERQAKISTTGHSAHVSAAAATKVPLCAATAMRCARTAWRANPTSKWPMSEDR